MISLKNINENSLKYMDENITLLSI